MAREYDPKLHEKAYTALISGGKTPYVDSAASIPRTKEKTDDLKQKSVEMRRREEQLEAEVRAAQEKLFAYQQSIAAERARVYEQLKLREHYFETVHGWESTVYYDDDSLLLLTLYQLKTLYYLQTGKILEPFRFSGERVHCYLMDEDDYKEYHVHELAKTYCRYCRSLFHLKEKCPKLQAKRCKACGDQGHDQLHCKMTVGDYTRRKQTRKYEGKE